MSSWKGSLMLGPWPEPVKESMIGDDRNRWGRGFYGAQSTAELLLLASALIAYHRESMRSRIGRDGQPVAGHEGEVGTCLKGLCVKWSKIQEELERRMTTSMPR